MHLQYILLYILLKQICLIEVISVGPFILFISYYVQYRSNYILKFRSKMSLLYISETVMYNDSRLDAINKT